MRKPGSRLVAGAALAMTALVAAAIPGAAAPPVPTQYASRPDLSPPQVQIESPARGTEPGYIFLDPNGSVPQRGPMIVDDSGQPVWFHPYEQGEVLGTTGLRTQTYRGEPVLTWWEGKQNAAGWGDGEFHVLDQSYEEVATVKAGNGVVTDQHDLTITPRNTALLLGYQPVESGGRQVVEGVVQEIDIATGRVLFDWRSLDHIAPEESTVPAPADPNAQFDYLHPNSVTEDANGNLLLSARNTDALYQIDRGTGAIQWRMGGVRSDFAVDPAAGFSRQHDARWLPNGQLSVFDNASDVPPPSRGVVLDVDQTARTARLAHAFPHPAGATSATQGNYQVLPGGHHFVGWGSQGQFTEYDAAGGVVLHASLGDGMQSYRALRLPWVGTPKTRPDIAIRDENGTRALYTSWNGATEVRGWRLLAGGTPFTMEPVGDVAKTGFETRGVVAGPERYIAAEALDANGNVLGRTDTIK